MEITNFPPVPMIDQHQSFTTSGRNVAAIQQQPTQQSSGSLGANFSGLIGNQVTVPVVPVNAIVTETSAPKKKRKKKSESSDSNGNAVEVIVGGEDVTVNPRETVENTVYADTYMDTNSMTYGVIQQADTLLSECKNDLDFIRAQRSMKGKYHYINNTVTTMGQLLSTKLSAIKEINSTIKAVNDNEYRRFKDMRAADQTDDNKALMDAYSAFISAPVGVPQYNLPGTAALTGGLNGVIRADYPPEVQASMDRGMANYLSNLTPEENLMLNDSNQDIEEVIIYDQASGAKRFQWMNTRTGEAINNMPPSSTLTIDDYVIDPRTGLAKNTNLNSIKKVVIKNGSSFDNF